MANSLKAIPTADRRYGQEARYQLKSLVCHHGDTTREGHYYAYVTVPDASEGSGQSSDGLVWLRLDDLNSPSVVKVTSCAFCHASVSHCDFTCCMPPSSASALADLLHNKIGNDLIWYRLRLNRMLASYLIAAGQQCPFDDNNCQ